jgi:hypothetical protein
MVYERYFKKQGQSISLFKVNLLGMTLRSICNQADDLSRATKQLLFTNKINLHNNLKNLYYGLFNP